MKIPVSVIVTVKNEENKIADCLAALKDFDEIIVVDSQSQDRTKEIVASAGAQVIDFAWNRQYPKKRQWCLDNLTLKHNWIFFVDADEIVTKELAAEIKSVLPAPSYTSGYFIRARYLMNGKLLKYGLQNNKLVLFDRCRIEFPIVDDLDIPGMGEMEGHYQPVLKMKFNEQKLGSIKSYMIHDCIDDERAWVFRHQKYARWEQGMNEKNAWPEDPVPIRDLAKKILRRSNYRPQLVFFISYIVLGGFLDGVEGYKFAKKKKDYYALIN